MPSSWEPGAGAEVEEAEGRGSKLLCIKFLANGGNAGARGYKQCTLPGKMAGNQRIEMLEPKANTGGGF